MGTDIPAEERAEITALRGHLIGPGHHGGPPRSRSVLHLQDYGVKGAPSRERLHA